MTSAASPTIYFENAAARLLEDPAGFLWIVWNSAERTFADLRELFGRVQLALEEHHWGRILIDQRLMQPFSPEEQIWITQEWLPRAVSKGGYRFGAVLISPDVMVRLATAYITTHVQGIPLQYRSFETPEAAMQWLLQQPVAAE
jgi:hypothetical protein